MRTVFLFFFSIRTGLRFTTGGIWRSIVFFGFGICSLFSLIWRSTSAQNGIRRSHVQSGTLRKDGDLLLIRYLYLLCESELRWRSHPRGEEVHLLCFTLLYVPRSLQFSIRIVQHLLSIIVFIQLLSPRNYQR